MNFPNWLRRVDDIRDITRDPYWTPERIAAMKDHPMESEVRDITQGVAFLAQQQQFAPRPLTIREKFNEHEALKAEFKETYKVCQDVAEKIRTLRSDLLLDLDAGLSNIDADRVELEQLKTNLLNTIATSESS